MEKRKTESRKKQRNKQRMKARKKGRQIKRKKEKLEHFHRQSNNQNINVCMYVFDLLLLSKNFYK